MSDAIARLGSFAGDGRFPIISKAVVHQGLLYTSGIVGEPGGDVAMQTQQALEQLDELLRSGGSDRSHILSAQVWLADMDDFAAHNRVWDAWVDENNAPVRACVGAPLYAPDVLVEIRVIAAVASGFDRDATSATDAADRARS